MAKNVLFFIIDSVTAEHLDETPYRHTPMPFLNKLKERCVIATQLYSQGPFTESAIIPLLSGVEMLNSGGYLQKFKYRRTVLQEFQASGYETFINHYYPTIYPTYSFPGVDARHHQSFFQFAEVWSYRFSYYAPLFLENKLSETEISMLEDILYDNFIAWIHITEQLLQRSNLVSILNENADLEGLDQDLLKIQQEYKTFQKDPKQYLTQLFTQKQDHILFQIPVRTSNRRVDPQVQREVCRRYRPIFDQIYKTNKKKNLRNLPFPLGRLSRALIHGDFHSAYQYAAMYRNAVWDKDLYDRIGKNYSTFKAAVPAINFINHYLEWLDNRNDSRPYFAYLHVDDAHAPESFFTTNSSDFSQLDNEFSAIQDYIAHLPKRYHGSLTSDLSLLYMDHCLEHLFYELKQRNILENTAIVITADHGFSYSYDPIRDRYVNTPHRENYHVPFLIYDESLTPEIRTGFYESKDVAPTLLDLCNLPIPPQMTGLSILSHEGRDHAFIEFMGGGCPDMLRRPIVLGVRTDAYSVITNIFIFDSFENVKITDVYDLSRDPQELHNIVSSVNHSKISYELSLLEARFNALREDFYTHPNAFNTPNAYEKRIASGQSELCDR